LLLLILESSEDLANLLRAFVYAYLSTRFRLHVIACTLLLVRYYRAHCCLWTRSHWDESG